MKEDELTILIEEIKALRDTTEELYILLDHAWRNRQEIYDLLDSRKPAESGGELYCCEQPDLRWNGEPDQPGVACGNCDFVVADSGAIITRTPEEIEEHREKTRERQRSLFE